MREDNKRQDMLIEELNTRLNCDVVENTLIREESKSFHVPFHSWYKNNFVRKISHLV